MLDGDFSKLIEQDNYLRDLEKINGIAFTPREIDVISCVLGRRGAKKIASLLGLSPRTVENHIYNVINKLKCSSQDGIIDFIEKSGKLALIRKHYFNLVTQLSFKLKLQKIANVIHENSPNCLILFDKEQKNKLLFGLIERDLKSIGFEVTQEVSESPNKILECFTQNFNNQPFDYIICAISQPTPTNDHSCLDNISNLKMNQWFNQIERKTKLILFLTNTPDNKMEFSENSSHFSNINLSEEKNYYFLFFNILKKLLQLKTIDNHIEEFKKQCITVSDTFCYNLVEEKTSLSNHGVHPIFEYILKQKKLTLLCGMFLIFVCIWFSYKNVTTKFWKSKEQVLTENIEPRNVRSSLPIPAKGSLLGRHNLIKQMEEKLGRQKGIQTISLAGLVGMGGVGKTTLARMYGRSHKGAIVYEINAETKNSLIASFYDLAKILTRTGTKESQDTLTRLNNIKNTEEKEHEILAFVQAYLKERSGWLLIYDNMEENFDDLQEYFPDDPAIWGNGQVIVTTRNRNLKGFFISEENVINVDQLTEKDALILFSTIYYGTSSGGLNIQNRAEIEEFLKNIPPFPLDVSLAASYLVVTHSSFDSYIEKLKALDHDFEKLQQKILKDKGDYDKTRTSIIRLSLNQLLDAHPDFKVLLLIMSLLDSQDIPRELFEKYKDKASVDKFIYHLQKYSLIELDKLKNINDMPVLSIHRSIQEISLVYLINALTLNKNNSLLWSITNVLEKYMIDGIDEENVEKTKLFINHVEAFGNHAELLCDDMINVVKGILGSSYYLMGEDKKAQDLLETSLSILRKTPERERRRIAKFSVSLGDLYRNNGIAYDKSRKLLVESLQTYRHYFPKEQIEIAQVLVCLGRINVEFNYFKDAQKQFEEALEIYKKYTPKDQCKIAGTLRRLGELFIITEDYKNAQLIAKQSLDMYQRHCTRERHNLAKANVILGSLYEDLGDYPQSKILLENGKILFEEIYGDKVIWNRIVLIRVHRKLGNYKKAAQILSEIPQEHHSYIWLRLCQAGLARDLGDLEISRNLYEEGLKFYQNNVSPDTLYVAWTKIELGRTYILLKRYSEAKKLIDEGVSIYKQLDFADNHPRLAWAYWCLSDVEMRLGHYLEAKNLLDKSLKTYENFYGKGHIKIARIWRSFGWLYFLQQDTKNTEEYFTKSLKIFETNNHPDKYLCLQDLGDLYLKHSEEKILESNSSDILKTQALKFYREALTIAQEHLPKGVPQIKTLETKIESLK